ncbi:MAG: hypothetical protein N2688_08405 [Burkholderiaceae bacterium]|nr:hypothetical protein [Burkholderiaceae bacterium]
MSIPTAILQLAGQNGRPACPTAKPIVVEVELLTPLFIAGADNQAGKRDSPDIVSDKTKTIAKEGLRPSAMKAALRFWWRAGFDPSQGLNALRAKEAELFGWVSGDSRGHQGQGLIVRTEVLSSWNAEWPKAMREIELAYLAYGCADSRGPLRPAISPGARARITLNPHSPRHETEIRQALERWLLFGGLGAKARRGFGSFMSLTDGMCSWKSETDLRAAIENHRHQVQSGSAQDCLWSTLWDATVLLKQLEGASWDAALHALGQYYHQFRKDLGADLVQGQWQQRPDKPYGPDHNRVWNWLQGRGLRDQAVDTADTLPDRAGFGLPLPMQFRNRPYKPVLEPVKDERKYIGDRRASPVILRLHKVGNQFYGLVLVLGGRFLPEGAQVQIREHSAGKLALPAPAPPPVLAKFINYLLKQGFVRVY